MGNTKMSRAAEIWELSPAQYDRGYLLGYLQGIRFGCKYGKTECWFFTVLIELMNGTTSLEVS